MPKIGLWNTAPTKHSLFEDAQGLFTGTVLAALGIMLLSKAGLLTGGVAGMAFLLHYAFGWSFGLGFFVINIPFYYLAYKRLGVAFTVKTFLSVGLLSLLTQYQPQFIEIGYVNPVWAAILGGLLIGMGMLALFRHRASLGGVGILALYLQDRFKWKAGLVQLAIDLSILCMAFFVTSPLIALASVVSAVALNFFIVINHRTDRYIAM
ncbi:YitT family protein [Rhizobium sp. KVB221]|uniref:YitT family protein n=1 Tax=Rhizobium setariae TaxID=2801340 RepID=A0A937CPI8_9HYPH|nr:YitT family protein [Rhizobium setariae]MBL0371857.1 YitT family protein [Rhizobium setariae]